MISRAVDRFGTSDLPLDISLVVFLWWKVRVSGTGSGRELPTK